MFTSWFEKDEGEARVPEYPDGLLGRDKRSKDARNRNKKIVRLKEERQNDDTLDGTWDVYIPFSVSY